MSEKPVQPDTTPPTVEPRTGSGFEALQEALAISFRLLRGALIALAVAYALSGLFLVRPHERAVVLLLGRVLGVGEERARGPGLHWTWPRPFAEVRRVETERVRSVETLPPPKTPEPDAPPPTVAWDEYLLTGDANLVRASWTLLYTVDDPLAWLFEISDGEAVLRNLLAEAVTRTTARFGVDAVLRTDVDAVREAVEARVRERVAAAGLGARVQRVVLVHVMPPPPTAAAFDDVIRAEQERSRQISEARAYATRVERETEGETARRIAEAEAARQRLVAAVAAEAAYFRAVRPWFRKMPQVVADTLYQEAVRRILSRVREVYVVRPAAEGAQELRLWLGPRPPGPRARGGERR